MSSRFAEAFTLLRRSSAGFPAVARIHVLGRFLTCPFLAVVDALPPGARVLDVGAGHGVLARLSVEGTGRHVIAVEPDARKIPCAVRHTAIRWICGADSSVRGQFDAVVLCDVLYRVPAPERDPLLGRLRERLRPGGILVVKDVDPTRRLKFAWNLLQETVAIHGLRLTRGAGQTYEPPDAIRRRLEGLGFVAVTAARIDRGYPHSHILYTARRPV